MTDRTAWRIDALDARGGHAFASWRAFDLAAEAMHVIEAPCVFIAPPSFRPEPVATRIIARAAGRGPFQPGLFVGQAEVGFASIDALAEFVRRVYLRGGGGDGLDGGSAPVPPRPEGGGSDLPAPPMPEPEEPGGEGAFWLDEAPEPPGGGALGSGSPDGPRPSPTGDLRDCINAFRTEPAGSANSIQGQPVVWSLARSRGAPAIPNLGRRRQAKEVFTRAALLLIREMLVRLLAVDTAERQRHWERAARALGWMIEQMNLWEVLFGPQLRGPLERWADFLFEPKNWPRRAAVHAPDHSAGLDRVHAMLVMLFGWPRLVDFEADSRSDPFEELSVLPLPPQFAPAVSTSQRENATMAHLLTAAIGAPSEVLGGQHGDDALALLLFAAARVVLGYDAARPASSPSPVWAGVARLRAYRLERLGADAWAWLAESLPRLAFPEPLEKAIASASALRLNGDDGTRPLGPRLSAGT